jgi:hypothetical protein
MVRRVITELTYWIGVIHPFGWFIYLLYLVGREINSSSYVQAACRCVNRSIRTSRRESFGNISDPMVNGENRYMQRPLLIGID